MTTHNSMKLVQELEQLINTKKKAFFFNEHSIFSLENLYKYHCYMETVTWKLKIVKLKCPVSICNLLVPSLRDSNLSLRIPKVILDLSKNNFVY